MLEIISVAGVLASVVYFAKFRKQPGADRTGVSKLRKISGRVAALGSSELLKSSTIYDTIRIDNAGKHTIINRAAVCSNVDSYLHVDSDVTLYYIQNDAADKEARSSNQVVFGIECNGHQAEDIDRLIDMVANVRKFAIKLMMFSVPMCIVGIGFIIFPISFLMLINGRKVPPKAVLLAFMGSSSPSAISLAA